MDPRELSKLMADEYSVKILSATFKVPRSVNYLSMKFEIPIAACYRRMKVLEEAGLVKPVERVFTKFGKWVWTYQSNLKYANLVLEDGRMKMYVELADKESPEHRTEWKVLESEIPQ